MEAVSLRVEPILSETHGRDTMPSGHNHVARDAMRRLIYPHAPLCPDSGDFLFYFCFKNKKNQFVALFGQQKSICCLFCSVVCKCTCLFLWAPAKVGCTHFSMTLCPIQIKESRYQHFFYASQAFIFSQKQCAACHILYGSHVFNMTAM